jgi:BlaI family transcriptional regulator, penicillinase repressor
MPVKPQSITDAELAILKLLWVQQSQTAREIRDALYPGGAESELATVQKLLHRLNSKGFVVRDRSAVPHTFAPAVTRDDVAGRHFDALADKLTEGSLVPFILHAVSTKRLSAKDRAAIIELLRQRP